MAIAPREVMGGHSNGVEAVAIAPDGFLAVSASWDNTLKLLDLETGEVLATFIGEILLELPKYIN
ncbi:WD40 repeat domain-containing protein [Limnospira fusiformis]|uniref:WD40 repeat domain-containing protein n=1 Tax=Limnospira fusiformis TaxID=54297 RepID=UPI0034E0C91A